MTAQTVWLLAGLLLAHSLGDFSPLATPRMLEAKANGGPLGFIALHAAVHTLLITLVIILVASPASSLILIAAAIEFSTHFALDAVRALLATRFPALNEPADNRFWYALGIDQLFHGLVLVGLAGLVL
jgi:hypothetical protein